MLKQLFDIYGKDCVDESTAVAKQVIHENHRKSHYVLKCNFGIDSGHFYNPDGMWTTENKTIGQIGKEKYTFSKVDEDTFNLYLKFLKTKNKNYLTNAERSVIV